MVFLVFYVLYSILHFMVCIVPCMLSLMYGIYFMVCIVCNVWYSTHCIVLSIVFYFVLYHTVRVILYIVYGVYCVAWYVWYATELYAIVFYALHLRCMYSMCCIFCCIVLHVLYVLVCIL